MLQNEFLIFFPRFAVPCWYSCFCAACPERGSGISSCHGLSSVCPHPPRFPLVAPRRRSSPRVEGRGVFVLLLSWTCTNVYSFASFHLSEQCLSASDTVCEGTCLLLCGKGGCTAWYTGVGQSLSCHCFADGFRRGRKAVPNPTCVLSLLMMMMHLHLGHPPAVATQQVTQKNSHAV